MPSVAAKTLEAKARRPEMAKVVLMLNYVLDPDPVKDVSECMAVFGERE